MNRYRDWLEQATANLTHAERSSVARHYTSNEARQAVDMAGEVISHCERESLET